MLNREVILFALLFALLRRVIGSGRPSADRELEIEVVVLRHQVKVLSSGSAAAPIAPR